MRETTPEKSLEAILEEVNTFLDLFEHEGWKLFMKQNKEQLALEKDQAHLFCDTSDKWHFHRGGIFRLEGLLALETMVEHTHAQVIEAIEARDNQAKGQANGEDDFL